MRTSLAAAAMAASLTVGGAAGVTLFTPSVSGAQTDAEATETETARPALAERLRETLQPLVDDATLDAEQADAVAEHLAEEAPFRHGHRHGPGLVGRGFAEDVLDLLSLSADELRDRLQGGQSLADIAEAEGIEVDDVVDAIVTSHQERLDRAVADGHLTPEQAEERAAMLEEHVQELVERTFDPGSRRDDRTHGPGSQDDPAADGTTDS